MKTGILITNLGSPAEPTAEALRAYLGQFLWDKRVVDTFRPLWWLILHGIILRVRPAKSAELYQKVWTQEGSPLVNFSYKQLAALKQSIQTEYPDVLLSLGMRYGKPSLAHALDCLRKHGVQKIVVLPLYPQFSYTTTESTRDEVMRCLRQKISQNQDVKLEWIESYQTHPAYIQALTQSILDFWQHHGRPSQILFSYHGLPQRYVKNGDPYFLQCRATTLAVVQKLGLQKHEWKMVFQSRFGKEPWLKPYADEVLIKLAKSTHKNVHVICPGFAADCLETLEEINQQYRQVFMKNGGEVFHYIPALNVRPDHIKALTELVRQHL